MNGSFLASARIDPERRIPKNPTHDPLERYQFSELMALDDVQFDLRPGDAW
jgi:hypothetical protein